MYDLSKLQDTIKGEVKTDTLHKLLYATDASAYREMPVGVVYPKDKQDLHAIIRFARENKITLIPRTAGTSLAGQVVGQGLIVDVSKHMTSILEINEKEHWVRVQPGVILDELNREMAKHNLFFGPETSTSSRCMIGGMVGNNSCGAHSLIYGSTREHTLEIKTILSDNSEVEFKALSRYEFLQKCHGENLENRIYRQLNEILSSTTNQQRIREQFPDPEVERRNTGYAIDMLLESEAFTPGKAPINLCSLLAGSEGTLAFFTEIKLNLVPLPPKNKALICVHLETIDAALRANLIALNYKPVSVELMDKAILDLTKENTTQLKNRFFVEGDPGAILIVEFAEEKEEEIQAKATAMEIEMRAKGFGYHFPIVKGTDIKKVWDLRKAGLGVLSNMPGDAKPVPVIEDTAVSPKVLPEYIAELNSILKELNLECVYYAHIATGELHLRPILNLKKPEDVELFHTIALETAKLVKKYRGSVSGEHGDGRLRGEFIPLMIGEENYHLIKEIKALWDPHGIFNYGKITDTPKMNTSLRFNPNNKIREIETYFDFSKDQGLLRAIEKCNGSGDCRKPQTASGGMCPSYQASLNEKNTTRARANILREFLTNSNQKNIFDHQEMYDILDECLSCKLCKSECPSNVDMAKYKAEFMQHYYQSHKIPLRTLAIANITKINSLGAIIPTVFNFFVKNKVTSNIAKKILGFATKRSIPTLHQKTLKQWAKKNLQPLNSQSGQKGRVFLFVDEFTNYNDTPIGIKAIESLIALGYRVEIPEHTLSGRTYLSKGMLKKARKYIDENIRKLSPLINSDNPLVGIEPSAILGFRDEYPELCSAELREKAKQLSQNALLFEEFFMQQAKAGQITPQQFTTDKTEILLHGHCQQKAVAGTFPTRQMLSFPQNYTVSEIPSGCCGMAGSFGYEKEHYSLSLKVGELVLLPNVRNAPETTVISAPGTSCRHQIKDGTDKTALHPIEIIANAIN